MPADCPKLAIGDIKDLIPHVWIIDVHSPILAQVLVEQMPHAPRQPGAGMDSVGNVGDRDIIFTPLRPDKVPHLPGHSSVKLGYGVATLRKAQRQHGHAETIAPRHCMAGQINELVAGETQLRPDGRKIFIG